MATDEVAKVFADKNRDLIDKKSKYEIGSSLLETAPDLIPTALDDVTAKYRRFKKSASSAGFGNFGIREYKCSLLMCIKHFLGLSWPELISPNDYEVATSLSADDLNLKVAKALVLYKLALPKIRQFIVY